MATLHKSHDLFGEEWAGYEVQSMPVRGGTAYWISYTVDNTKTVEPQHEILIRFEDGTSERIAGASDQELSLWTTHLQ